MAVNVLRFLALFRLQRLAYTIFRRVKLQKESKFRSDNICIYIYIHIFVPVCVSCYHNIQLLFPSTEADVWYFKCRRHPFSVRQELNFQTQLRLILFPETLRAIYSMELVSVLRSLCLSIRVCTNPKMYLESSVRIFFHKITVGN